MSSVLYHSVKELTTCQALKEGEREGPYSNSLLFLAKKTYPFYDTIPKMDASIKPIRNGIFQFKVIRKKKEKEHEG